MLRVRKEKRDKKFLQCIEFILGEIHKNNNLNENHINNFRQKQVFVQKYLINEYSSIMNSSPIETNLAKKIYNNMVCTDIVALITEYIIPLNILNIKNKLLENYKDLELM